MRVIRTITTTDAGVGGTRKYRGAQVWSLTANTLVFRAQVEPNLVGWLACPRSLANAMVLGDPACLEVSGAGAASYAIVTVHPTAFADRSGANTSVRAGAFHCGRIPDHLSGEKPYTPWYAGLRDR